MKTHLPEGLTCRVIGLGGIGQLVATFLVQFLCSHARNARVLLVDGDTFQPGDEQRVVAGRLYENKATALHARLTRRFEPSPVVLLPVPEYVVPGNVERLIRSGPGESVLLCVDNHATRNLVGTHASGLDDICLFNGGNDGVGPDGSGAIRQGTAGNVQIHVRVGGVDLTPSLQAFHPEIENPPDTRPDQKSCEDLAGSVPQIQLTNLLAASCVLNAWWLHAAGQLHYSELVFDIAKGLMGPLLPYEPEREG